MREQLLSEIRRRGVITRADALRVVAPHVVDDAVRAGAVVRVLPAVYALPGSAGDREIRRAAPLAHRPNGALSHTDALDVWGLPASLDSDVHVAVPASEPSS